MDREKKRKEGNPARSSHEKGKKLFERLAVKGREERK